MRKSRTEDGDAETLFVLMFRSDREEQLARIVIEGLRAFGGHLQGSRVWAFVLDTDRVSQALPGLRDVRRLPLAPEPGCPPYPFVEKVYACARAEELVGPAIRSLVWLSLDCLVVNPPLLFDLGPGCDAAPADAAFRPVHHRNIGSPADEPLDNFWREVYRTLQVDEMPYTVESFADRQILRPYFNTHCFALNPARGLAQGWWDQFMTLVTNDRFQAGACSDALHKLFLHQAVVSTMVAREVPWRRVRLLPPAYNYPLNLLDEIPENLRPPTLNSLVSAVYEDASPWNRIEIEEPLRAWLMDRFPANDQ